MINPLYPGKRWMYLIVGTAVLLFSGLIYGWSLFSRYFAELYPDWSLSQLSVTFTISMTCFCLQRTEAYLAWIGL